MQISVGDKVSFINEKLDGVVRAIVNNKLVKVEIEDGFIIDAMSNQLVIIKKFVAAETNHQLTTENEFTTDASGKEAESGSEFNTKANSIQFITSPAHENKVVSGDLNFYLHNNSAVEILFTMHVYEENKTTLLGSGRIAKQSLCLIATKTRNDVFGWNHLGVQVLFCENEFKRPLIKDIPIQLPSLSTASKTENSKNAFATYFLIADLNTTKDVELIALKQKLETNTLPKENFTSPLSALKQKRNLNSGSAILLNTKEVDLHIEELLDDFSNLSNDEIISVQLKKFTQELNNAIANHYKSIVFIHGVGNGKLKSILHNELKNYPEIKYRDGDYLKYGNGATEVLIE